jgi:hypothetical protein
VKPKPKQRPRPKLSKKGKMLNELQKRKTKGKQMLDLG